MHRNVEIKVSINVQGQSVDESKKMKIFMNDSNLFT
jgi:hypothetical protein